MSNLKHLKQIAHLICKHQKLILYLQEVCVLPVLRSCDLTLSFRWSTVSCVCPASINLGVSGPAAVLLRGLIAPVNLFAALSDDTV